jgi:hypothetical protein
MNTEESRRADLETRLRGLFGGLDAKAGFEARLMQRVATLSVTPRADLRAQFERRRERLRRRLHREAWMNGITTVGVGACAAALLWRFAPAIQQIAVSPARPLELNVLVFGTLAMVVVGVWLVIHRARG